MSHENKPLTLAEAKDILAKKNGFKDWEDARLTWQVRSGKACLTHESYLETYAELYMKSHTTALEEEIENLKSVMVAAAEEIQEHWAAHCDDEGYGPANLMHRLENCIAADYPGYKSGAFEKLRKENDDLRVEMENWKQKYRDATIGAHKTY